MPESFFFFCFGAKLTAHLKTNLGRRRCVLSRTQDPTHLLLVVPSPPTKDWLDVRCFKRGKTNVQANQLSAITCVVLCNKKGGIGILWPFDQDNGFVCTRPSAAFGRRAAFSN